MKREQTMMAPAAPSEHNDLVGHLTRHLYDRVTDYYPGLIRKDLAIQFKSRSVYPRSSHYRFEVKAGARPICVIAKISLPRDDNATDEGSGPSSWSRPRLVPAPDHQTRLRSEYEALRDIQRHFDALGDARFGVVRVLDFLPSHDAILMEEVAEPSLLRLLRSQNRLQRPFARKNLGPSFRNTGAWLRTFHSLQKQGSDYRTTRDEFVGAIAGYAGFLARMLNDAPFFHEVAAVIARTARGSMSDPLPIGLRHGDFATRNVLVGAEERITVIDTLARWRTVTYEDVAYFLVSLKTLRAQVLSAGMAFSDRRLGRYEEDFLLGYFQDEPIPLRAIRLYEALILLDKWSSLVSKANGAVPVENVNVRQMPIQLFHQYYRRILIGLLQTVIYILPLISCLDPNMS